jgi:hypothetical protein
MVRFVSMSLLAAGLCALESGCCCCRLPIGVPGPPIVLNPPPVIENPPPINPPPINPPVNPPPVNPPPFNPPPDNKPKINRYTYFHNTGQFKAGDQVIATGFSGTGEAKNDPWSYKEKVTGVIPLGDWKVDRRRTDAKTGEPVFDLHLFTGGHVKGRIPGENFTIHADNAPNAGESGIALPRQARDAIQIPTGLFDLALIEVREDKDAPPRVKTYTYSQSTGQLKLYSEVLGIGYSGKGKGRNDPAMQDVKDVGPIPAGEYEMIMRVADPNSLNFGSKLKLNPVGNFTKRWPAEDIWLATETNPPGNHPAIFAVFGNRKVVDRIDFNEKPRTRLRVVP